MQATQPTNRNEAPPRRTFFKLLTALVSIAAAMLLAIPGAGYFGGAMRRRKPGNWVRLGTVSSFPVGETRLAKFDNPLAQPWDGITAHAGVYVRNLGRSSNYEDQFQVFSIHCTHLGCPVEWFSESGLFMCPCHGGVYYEDGERASGPPPRGLYHCVWRVVQLEGQGERVLEVEAPFFPTLDHTLTDEA